MKQNFMITLVAVDGNLQPLLKSDIKSYNSFIKNLEDGQMVQVYYEALGSKGTLAQLASIHAGLKELSNYTGHSVEDLKIMLKIRSGLVIGDKVRSFSTCSVEELSCVIKDLSEWGSSLGMLI